MKFGNRADGPDAGVVELAYHRMAAAAGISICRSWLAGSGPRRRGWFVTERFDRSPRQHVHSACGLLHVDHRVPALDYTALLEAVRWLTRDQRAVEEAWRRAAFNVLAHNRDDHTRNTVFRMSPDGVWALAPAFDLTFSPGPRGEHWMTVAGEGRSPGELHLHELARRAGVPDRRARLTLDEVRGAIACWAVHAESVGAPRATRVRIGAVLGR